MDRPTSIPQHIWDGFSDEARTIVGAVVDGLERQVPELKQQVHDLEVRLDQNSTNSSRPPSTDPIGVKRKPPAPPSKMRRGGQNGHPRRMRTLVTPERVASVTECKPTSCRRCGHTLSGVDVDSLRRQVAESPPIEPEVHEYRLHRLLCPHCETVACGALPDGVPRTAFGPRLHAALSVLTGAYRLSKRQVAQLCSDLLGLTISLGMIAELERVTRLWDCLWTFTRVDGVEPTYNAAERALRHAVIWRRISGGTDSEGGSRFVERMLPAVATCRQQKRDVLEYLTRRHRARLLGLKSPS